MCLVDLEPLWPKSGSESMNEKLDKTPSTSSRSSCGNEATGRRGWSGGGESAVIMDLCGRSGAPRRGVFLPLSAGYHQTRVAANGAHSVWPDCLMMLRTLQIKCLSAICCREPTMAAGDEQISHHLKWNDLSKLRGFSCPNSGASGRLGSQTDARPGW
jgi:hypothetical protein